MLSLAGRVGCRTIKAAAKSSGTIIDTRIIITLCRFLRGLFICKGRFAGLSGLPVRRSFFARCIDASQPSPGKGRPQQNDAGQDNQLEAEASISSIRVAFFKPQ